MKKPPIVVFMVIMDKYCFNFSLDFFFTIEGNNLNIIELRDKKKFPFFVGRVVPVDEKRSEKQHGKLFLCESCKFFSSHHE